MPSPHTQPVRSSTQPLAVFFPITMSSESPLVAELAIWIIRATVRKWEELHVLHVWGAHRRVDILRHGGQGTSRPSCEQNADELKRHNEIITYR